ncbi:LytR/AlgR family response regulator transcription factor [Arundinibacter roseus]|uniref:LytTR family transcriptional regulator n=1 Tax=Arundinibacter roseus TaxID=2070510 RepID=A0A4R4K4V3_9BACT|nr:LytTR family DNA-binding domain-containing protein [Arundinibacter roseus]TDB62303.1 LytTR family transcriptional regulator [Arundinibacter roseus]
MKTFSNYSITTSTGEFAKAVPTQEIAVHLLGQTLWLKPQDITCLEGEGNYTYIYTCRGKRYLVSKTLKSLTEHLDEGFLRVHKSYMINTDYIAERLEEDRVIRMSCGKEVLVSRRKIKEIAEILNNFESRISA